MEKRIYFDHGGGCDCGGCSANGNSYEASLRGEQGKIGPQGQVGPPGKNNLLVGGITNSSGVLSADGTDEAINATAKSNLATAGFNIEAKPTASNVSDPSDTSSNKIWTGISRALINFFGLKVIPALVPTGGTAGQVIRKVDNVDYNFGWATPTNEIYNSVTTTSFGFNEATTGIIGSTVQFTVGTGYAYRFKNTVAIVDPVDPLDKYIEGVVEDYSAGKITVRIYNMKGSGNTSDYNVMLTAPEYLPYVKDPANYGKYLYNNSGVWETRTSLDSVGDTKVWWSATAPDASWWLCDGTQHTIDESPGLYQILVTNNGGAASPFYVSATEFALPNVTGAALVGVKVGGADAISLGQLVGQNILTGGIPAKNLPVTSPWQLNDPGHQHANSINADPASGESLEGDTAGERASAGNSNSATTGITVKTNNIAGGQAENGGQDLDVRQKSIGMYLYIKAL